MNCEMLDVKLKVDSPMMADYLAYLFPPDSPGGPLKVYARNSIGRLLVAHCKVAEGPVALEGDKVVDLELPSDIATAPMRDKFLYYDKYSTVALNMAINAFFDIEFKQYYLAGYELGVQKKDIVTAFIVSRGLFSTDYFDALHKRIYNGFDDAKHMTRIQSNTDYIASAAIMSEVSQQFTPKWTPKGAAKFTPIRIPYRRHKLNVLIQPADVLKSWLLYLYEQGKTMADMPITRYIIENHILPKVLDDITISMIAKGKFIDAGVVADGDAGKAAKNSMDGFETILVEGKSDENCKINYYKAAADPMAMSDSELLAYINGFVDSISGLFAHIVTIHCSEQLLTRYKRADFAVNGKYTGVENDGSIRFTNFHLVPLKSMYNSPIIFATPKENFVELVDLSKAENCIVKIEEQNYDVKVFGEYSLSTGFKIAEAVYAAVPDGYTPVESIVSDVPDTDKWENGKKAADNTKDQGSDTNPDQGQGGA